MQTGLGVLLWIKVVQRRWIIATFSRTPSCLPMTSPEDLLFLSLLLFVLSPVALAFSPITLFIRWDHILGILNLISFVFFPPTIIIYLIFQKKQKKKTKCWIFTLFFLMGFNSQPGAADVCDSQAGAELLDILRRKVSLFSFNVVLCLFDFTMFQLVAM